jgi:hypothetical protein
LALALSPVAGCEAVQIVIRLGERGGAREFCAARVVKLSAAGFEFSTEQFERAAGPRCRLEAEGEFAAQRVV